MHIATSGAATRSECVNGPLFVWGVGSEQSPFGAQRRCHGGELGGDYIQKTGGGLGQSPQEQIFFLARQPKLPTTLREMRPVESSFANSSSVECVWCERGLKLFIHQILRHYRSSGYDHFCMLFYRTRVIGMGGCCCQLYWQILLLLFLYHR